MIESSQTDLELMEIQVNTLFTHDSAGRIVADNEPDGEPAPCAFVGRTPEGILWRVRHDLPDVVVRTVEEVVANHPAGEDDLRCEWSHVDELLAALRMDHTPRVGHSGPSFRFPLQFSASPGVTKITPINLHLLQRMGFDVDGIRRDLEATGPWMAKVLDGGAVATCFSCRLSDRAAEARVDTQDGFRGRGYATETVSAWAAAIRESGRIPLYGTSWDNHASQSVARKLGLIQFGASICIE